MPSEAVLRIDTEILVNWIPDDVRLGFDFDAEDAVDYAKWVVRHFLRWRA